MDPIDTLKGLAGFSARRPCGDAERRAALWLARQVRAGDRREAELRTHWVRPQWPMAHALHAALAVIGSLVTVSSAPIGLGILTFAFVSMSLELSGRALLLRLLFPRRATQNVVSPAPSAGAARGADRRRVRLIVTAAYDAGHSGVLYRDGVARTWARVARGHAPSPFTVLLAAVALLTAIAGLRLGGVDGDALRLIALLATVVPLLALAALLDIALSSTVPGANDPASGAGVALALVDALDRAPPANLGVELVLAGAGEAPTGGMRAYVRELRRRRVSPEDVVVLEIRACGAGTPRYWTRDGVALPLRLHPRLVALAARAAAQEPHLGAKAQRGHSPSAAYAARAAGWPAIAIGCLDGDGLVPRSHQHDDTAARIDPRAPQAALELALAFVDELDRELGRGRGGDADRGTAGQPA